MMKSVSFRTVFGFLLAPLFPGLVVAIVGGPFVKWHEGLWVIKLSAMLGYPTAVVLGIPLYFLLGSRKWNGLGSYIAVGALLGFITYLIYTPPVGYSSNGLLGLSERFLNTAPVYIPLGMICGAVAAICFWLIARPDRSGGVTE